MTSKKFPWITFTLQLNEAPPKLWMDLGEAKSKCEHIAGVPLRPNVAKELHQIYLAKGVQATTAIEGNTLSFEEVKDRIDDPKPLPQSKEYLGQEVDNVIGACNTIKEGLIQSPEAAITIDSALIQSYNAKVLHKLDGKEEVTPGPFRLHEVGVGNYRAPDAKHCKQLIDNLCDWLNGPEFKADDELAIVYGILKAIIAHIYIAWIHPFGDGNGRTARLLEFQILLESGVPAPAAQLLSNHYNQTRTKYYRELDKTSRSGGDLVPFIHYAVQGFVDGLKEQLALIRRQQLHVAWLNYIHQSFLDQQTKVKRRRKQLAYDLCNFSEEVPLSKIKDISPAVARMYATKKEMVIWRDLNELIKMEIVEKTEKGYRPKPETILAFLPFRKT